MRPYAGTPPKLHKGRRPQDAPTPRRRPVRRSQGASGASQGKRKLASAPKVVLPAHPPILLPLVDQFLNDVGGEYLNSPSYADWLQEQIKTPGRVRQGTFSASALGTCPRAQVFTYLGVPSFQPDEIDVQQSLIYSDGTWRHLRWQGLLWELAIRGYLDLFVPEVRATLGLTDFMGSLDGEVTLLGGDVIGVEIKGAGHNTFHTARNAPFFKHLLQVHGYMIAAGLERFSVLYEDKSTQETVEHVIHRDPEVEASVRAEIDTLTQAASNRKLPPVKRACKDGTSQTYFDCQYHHVCLGCGDWEQAEAFSSGQAVPAPRRRGEARKAVRKKPASRQAG